MPTLQYPTAVCALILVASTCAVGCTRGSSSPAPRKILLVSIDTTRADHLSGYGHERITSPFLDVLASAGVRMERAYATMPTTDPSHASMLTGEYPRTHGITFNGAKRTNVDGPSLAAWLGERGYTTAAITARLGLDPKLRRIRGFDHTDAPTPAERWREAETVVALTRQWLASRDRDDRWFLWVHLWEPHKPYSPPEPYRSRYLDPQIAPRFINEDPPRFVAGRKLVPHRTVDAVGDLYEGEIARADAAVEEIVGLAEAAAPAPKDLLIVIVADHGELLGERQERDRVAFGHGALLYESVIRVPWIVVWRSVIEPRVITTPVSLVDLTPTLAALVDPGAELPVEGRSIAAAFFDGSEPPSVPVAVERRPFGNPPVPRLGHEETAWIDYPWKLIDNEGAAAPELYRLDFDPEEANDRAGAEPERTRELQAALAAWQASRPTAAPAGGPSRREQEALRALGYVD